MRKEYRVKRTHLDDVYRKRAAISAANILAQQTIFKKSKNIACYMHFRDEMDTGSIIRAIWRAKKNCYLPVLAEDNTLRFVIYKEGDKLVANRYSIKEPEANYGELPPDKLDLVITPLLAYDLEGNRLGTGGGYYDRTFASLKNKPAMIGFAYAVQQASKLPQDAWDVNLDAIVTENGYQAF